MTVEAVRKCETLWLMENGLIFEAKIQSLNCKIIHELTLWKY